MKHQSLSASATKLTPYLAEEAQKASVVPISCLLLPEPTSGRRAGFEDLDLHCVSNAGQLSVSQNGTSVG